MSFASMASEVHGSVPKMPVDYSYTCVSRAYKDVRRQNLWSFLLFDANWTTPSIVNAGTVTVTQGLKTVVFNAAASAAITAIGLFPSAVTQRQFRIGIGTIYNIWSITTAGGGIVTLTLDRAYQEASGAGVAYMIYQVYYAAPMQDFWSCLSVMETTNFNDLVTTKSRAWLNATDPQRTVFYLPTHVVPYQKDQNPASPTFGFMLFELWGSPTFNLTYQLYGIRKGIDLVNDADLLPAEIGEDCVLALAKKYSYEWAEANKGDMPRAVGSDYRFLIGDTKSEYKRLYMEYRKQDREVVDNWRTRLRKTWTWPSLCGYYSSIAGVASPGAPW
jgi:hypothetical protein